MNYDQPTRNDAKNHISMRSKHHKLVGALTLILQWLSVGFLLNSMPPTAQQVEPRSINNQSIALLIELSSQVSIFLLQIVYPPCYLFVKKTFFALHRELKLNHLNPTTR